MRSQVVDHCLHVENPRGPSLAVPCCLPSPFAGSSARPAFFLFDLTCSQGPPVVSPICSFYSRRICSSGLDTFSLFFRRTCRNGPTVPTPIVALHPTGLVSLLTDSSSFFLANLPLGSTDNDTGLRPLQLAQIMQSAGRLLLAAPFLRVRFYLGVTAARVLRFGPSLAFAPQIGRFL